MRTILSQGNLPPGVAWVFIFIKRSLQKQLSVLYSDRFKINMNRQGKYFQDNKSYIQTHQKHSALWVVPDYQSFWTWRPIPAAVQTDCPYPTPSNSTWWRTRREREVRESGVVIEEVTRRRGNKQIKKSEKCDYKWEKRKLFDFFLGCTRKKL